jgi:hypothetical protein
MDIYYFRWPERPIHSSDGTIRCGGEMVYSKKHNHYECSECCRVISYDDLNARSVKAGAGEAVKEKDTGHDFAWWFK